MEKILVLAATIIEIDSWSPQKAIMLIIETQVFMSAFLEKTF